MEIENSSYGRDSDSGIKTKENGSTTDHVNGLSNGYTEKEKSHKSENKDKHRDKDREKDRDKDKSKSHKSSSRDKDRERDRDKEKHSSSKDKDKDRHSSSHKSSNKDKDRDKERSDKDKSRSDKDKDRSDRDKDRSKEKEKRDKDKYRDKEKSSSSKDHKSSSKDKDREKDRDKEREREKDKEKSSSKDKDRKDKDRDKDREKDKNRHSSSSKDKDKHKDRSKDKERHSSSKDKDRDKHKSEKHEVKEVKTEIKEEIKEVKAEIKPEIKEEIETQPEVTEDSINEVDEVDIKQEDDFDSQDNVNVSQASSCDYNLSTFKTEPEESDEDIPLRRTHSSHKKLAGRISDQKVKRKIESDEEDDDIPLAARKKPKTEKKKKRIAESDYEDEVVPVKKEKKKKIKIEVKPTKSPVKTEENSKKKKKKEAEEPEVWKWWEEEKKDDGTKWNFLEHKGPVFAPPYEPLPPHVKFWYDGKEMKLSELAEEVAGFYAKMLEHDYTTKDIFNNNFFKDWRKCMNDEERAIIKDLKKCNFKSMHTYFMEQAEKNRNRTKEEKKALKEKNEEIQKEYGTCLIDGHKEKIGNFKIEPPGLFRGRGEHPKMGMLKRRVMPEDVLINCSKDSKIPTPPPGHKWKEVRSDPNVTWLASWTENVQNQVKYVMLNPSSKLKGEKDWQKYETARRLDKQINQIRKQYKEDWKSKEMRIRQRAVALYFIDKLALRAGNEKDEDQADTVGCCSLRVEHIELHEKKDGKEYVVVFDFLGKDSIRYYNEVPVEKRVFKNLQLFMESKEGGDDLFDRLNTQIMNKHLNELMEGLTAKVFRTYNASSTLQQQLDLLTNEEDSVAEKILSYNRANRAVAILCNHQRSVPKGHEKSMEKLKEKIDQKREQIDEMVKQVKDAAKDAKHGSVKEKMIHDKKKKGLERLRDQLKKLEVQETDRDENKTIALGTSKLNYLDPRISVAWCKKYDVPIEKIYNKTQRDKFRWAIDMAGPDYRF